MKASYRYTLEVMSEAMKVAHLNTAKFIDRATMLIGFSHKMVGFVADNSLDFVYIDANHMKSQVVRDIQCWYPKVRRGGLVSGHDYDVKRGKYKGVITAVNGFARDKEYIVRINDTNWWFVKH
jgi:predicted O-methyltransferase YrrM